jgi:hypothetical protein
MRPSALTSFLCLALGLAFGARSAAAASEGFDGPKNTLSVHPFGTLLLNVVPDFHFFQFTYEYHPGTGRLSWAWDPALVLNDEGDAKAPHGFDFWLVPIVTPRWYFRSTGQGWFGGAKAGFIHISFKNDEKDFFVETHHERTEMGYLAGEIGFKKDWSLISLYVSGQLGSASGTTYSTDSEGTYPATHSSSGVTTPFVQLDAGLGFRF